MNKYLLEITVFVGGAIVMIFELVGSRVLGPYLGSSTVVWTTLIGVVMASLSLGYYWGGHLADKKATTKILSLIVFGAGVCVLSTFFVMDILLSSLSHATDDKMTILFLSAILLFAPASVLLGMISPYAAKLKLCDLKSSGTTIGNLYALSTMGSIVGTFMAGFYLIPRFGTTTILLLIAFCLLALSLFLSFGKFGRIKIAGLFVVGTLFFFGNITEMIYADSSLVDVDTEYARVWVFDAKEADTGREDRNLKIDKQNSSAMYLDGSDLVYEYTKFYDLAAHFKPDFKKSLLLGGAAYSYPKYYLEKYPEKKLDVVEIDPRLTEIAKEHFKLKDKPNLRIFHEDARIFLNKNKEKYDVIFGDAFGSQLSIPFHLTTKEAVLKNFDAFADDGVVVCNIISSIEGKNGKFLRAEYLTYKSIFPQVYLFPVQRENEGETLQNVILVALKSEKKPAFKNDDAKLQEYLDHLWKEEVTADVPILTDNYAPVEYYAKMARY
jgi:spermidine synthase